MTIELVETPSPETLTSAERDQLRDLETTVAAGLQTFVQVGNALAEIQQRRLYRADHASFEDYLESRWGLTRSQGYRAIAAATVVSSLPEEQAALIQRESHARPLVGLDAEQARTAVRLAAERAGEKPLTAALITEAAREVTGAEAPPKPEAPVYPEENAERFDYAGKGVTATVLLLELPGRGWIGALTVQWTAGQNSGYTVPLDEAEGVHATRAMALRVALYPLYTNEEGAYHRHPSNDELRREIKKLVGWADGLTLQAEPRQVPPANAESAAPPALCDGCAEPLSDPPKSRVWEDSRWQVLCPNCHAAREARFRAQQEQMNRDREAREARERAWHTHLFDTAFAHLREIAEPGRRELAFLAGMALTVCDVEDIIRVAEGLELPEGPVEQYLMGLGGEYWVSAWEALLEVPPVDLVRLAVLAATPWAHASYLGLEFAAPEPKTAPSVSPIGNTVPAPTYAEFLADAAPDRAVNPDQCATCGTAFVEGACRKCTPAGRCGPCGMPVAVDGTCAECASDLECARCGNPIPGDVGLDADECEELPGGTVLDPRGHILTRNGAVYCRQCRPHVAICRNCGCTEEAACPGGCAWVTPDKPDQLPDLCSECVWEPGRYVRRWQDEVVFQLVSRIVVHQPATRPDEWYTTWSTATVRKERTVHIDQTPTWSANYTLLPRDWEPTPARICEL